MKKEEVMSISVNSTYTVIDCPNCGILFAVTEELEERRRKDGKDFYCPNGHSMAYGNSDTEKLKKERDRSANLVARLDQERARRDHAERSRSAMKGQLTKVKKRVANGVCPCCNRSFEDLARHMSTQHPDYVEAQA